MARFPILTIAAVTCAALWAQERPALRTVLIDGQPLTYQEQNGLAIIEGDLIVGRAADLESASGKSQARTALLALTSLGNPQLWPQGVMYYTIDASVPNQNRILDAIAYWNTNTPLKLQLRAGQADYVRFLAASGNCSSSVGRIGGQQIIQLDDACSTGNVIHEIGHAFGLLHEQSRADRNTFVTVLYENIDTTYYSQYAQTRNSRDLGYYDYDSTMHYPSTGFSYNGRSTQATSPPGIPIGQRTGLSANDIDSISRVYGFIPTKTTVTSIPEGLNVQVDGETYRTPAVFEWLPGTNHTIGATDQSSSNNVRYRFARWSDGGSAEHVFQAGEDRTVVAAQFQQRIRLTVNSRGGGTVSVQPPSEDGFYTLGSEVRISARPDAGLRFLSWSGASFASQGFGSGAETLAVELNSSVNLTATFTDRAVTVVDSRPSGRQVQVDGFTFTTPARFTWEEGSTHTLNVRTPQTSSTASTRYRFSGWEDGTSEALRTVTAGSGDVTYRVRLVEQHYLDFTRTGGFGTTSVDPPQDGSYIDAGTTVELRVSPSGAQSVQYWLGDVIGTGNTQTVLMDRPKRAVAVIGSPQPFRVVHAGSYATNPWFEQPGMFVAPLELVTVFGAGVGPAAFTSGVLDSQGRLSTELAGTRVLFDGVAAPVLNTSSGQTSVFVPVEVAGKSTVSITVERNGQTVGTVTYGVSPTLPGLFTANASGTGPVVAINPDGSRNSKDRPADAGSFVVLYATGAGLMDRPFANGEVADGRLSSPQQPVYARVGKETAEVYYAGSAPGFAVGVIQMNVRIPAGMPAGEWPLRVVMGNGSSPPGVTIAVK